MKKRILAVLCAAVLLLLSACGSASSKADYAEAGEYAVSAAYETAAEEDYDSMAESMAEIPMEEEKTAAGNGGTRAYNGDVKLIYRAEINAQTTDIGKTAEQIEALTEGIGGYIESSDVSSNRYNSGVYRYAYYTVRVPSEKYEYFLESLNSSDACTVTNLLKTTTDVGAEYADNEAHLATCRIKQERLQKLLEEAESMEDIIAIETALTDVEYEIEYYSSSLNRYDALINFSTVTINLEEVDREEKTAGDGTLGERIASSFSNGISSFASGFEDLVVAAAGAVIPLIIIAAVIIVIVTVFFRLAKKKGNGKRKKEETEDKE